MGYGLGGRSMALVDCISLVGVLPACRVAEVYHLCGCVPWLVHVWRHPGSVNELPSLLIHNFRPSRLSSCSATGPAAARPAWTSSVVYDGSVVGHDVPISLNCLAWGVGVGGWGGALSVRRTGSCDRGMRHPVWCSPSWWWGFILSRCFVCF